MPFWSTNFGADATLKDPKRKFRFTVTFDGISADGGLLWYAKSVDKPKFVISTAEHKFVNHTFYYPGNVEWQEISVSLVDPVDPDMTATFADMVVASGYSPPANPVASEMGSISKAKAANALGQVTIRQIDSDGNPLETWTLYNAFLTKMESDELSYGDAELMTTTIGLRYDWATCETTNASSAKNGSGGNTFFNA